MILDTVYVSSDLNPFYLDFWPLVHTAWTQIIKVKVKLLLIADHIPDYLEHPDDIILIKPIEGIKNAFYAQCIRMLYPCLQNHHPNRGIMMSDIDMIPLSSEYFTQSAVKYNDNQFVYFRGNMCMSNRQIAICYCMATSKVYRKIFGILKLEGIKKIETIIKTWYKETGGAWTTDQQKLFQLVHKNVPKDNFIKLTDGVLRFNRLDRSMGVDRINKLVNTGQVKHFVDFHMPRPMRNFRGINEKVLNYFLS
uniref:Nucleotide-diphospho-sugar transferase domain-containing protein n=1 Tax=viral metagenome TaxID=1070528 RepID=A0A6C0CK94_9ZZZZ